MPQKNNLKMVLISSVLPLNTTGGEAILYRHLSRWPDLNLIVVSENSEAIESRNSVIRLRPNRLLKRLKKTRLARWVNDVVQCFGPFYAFGRIEKCIKREAPDAILTVAHGELCWLAEKLSRRLRLPLISIFHDWWPDSAYVHSYLRWLLTAKFHHLYRMSKLVFCVNEEMKAVLGDHPNAQVLYPIPREILNAGNISSGKVFTVVYAGISADVYGPMLQDICNNLHNNPNLQIKIFGPCPGDWPQLAIKKLQESGNYKGYIREELLVNELHAASAFLVVMPFSNKNKMRARTSFPSKIIDYCQFGKPIIIWGPEYCSAVRWAKQYQSALVVSSPRAEELVKAINTLMDQPAEQERLSHKAIEMAQTIFNPTKIQEQFVDEITRLRSRKTNDC